MFPIGLFAFLANGTQNAFWAWATGGFIIGWVLYAVLSGLLFNAKNKRVFIAIYIIFCILLALNVGGCVKVLGDTSHIQ
jgi:biotin transporter BioY